MKESNYADPSIIKQDTDRNTVAYGSHEKKSNLMAKVYNDTQTAIFRYLAYRDIPNLLKKYVNGFNALDYGCGTGISTQFLVEQKFNTTGIDISEAMLEQAPLHCPQAKFYHNADEKFHNLDAFDLIFSSFVLFELASKTHILEYLNNASHMLKENGIFLAVTGSQYMYTKDWLCFNSQYKENQNLKSGDKAKIFVPEANMEFTDYYWTEADYRHLFNKSNLFLTEVYYPLGKSDELFLWKEEIAFSPFLILIAKSRF